MRRVGTVIAGLWLAGCATAPRPTPLDRGDAAFARGDNGAAASTYAEAAKTGATPDELFRARFFELLARRAEKGPAQFDATLAGLRKLAAEAAGNRWGRLAALYADEMGQADALRWAVQRAGADIGKLQAKITALETALAQEKQGNTQLSATVKSLEDERAQLQHNVHELEAQLQDRNTQLTALSAELQALKSIDLSRGP